MKSQKRNPEDRAMVRGYQAGVSGKSKSLCPFETSNNRHVWLAGWREGREDLWNGYNVHTQLQKTGSL